MAKVLLRKETIISILSSIIEWYSGMFGKDGKPIEIRVSNEKDSDFIETVGVAIESLNGVHQDIQAEYADEIKSALDRMVRSDASSLLPADILSMMISYYKNGESYKMLASRFDIPLYKIVMSIAYGEKVIFENFDFE